MKKFLKELIYLNRNMKNSTKVLLIILIAGLAMTAFRSSFLSIKLLIYIGIILFSISFHEAAHGFSAWLVGDDTAKLYGRVSFNPLRHMDPLGLLFPVIMAITGSPLIIGWAKPVPIDYSRIRFGRAGEFIVAVSGIVANIILVVLSLIIIIVADNKGIQSPLLAYALVQTYSLNLLLIILNIMPIPPLDGSKILASIGPQCLRDVIFYLENYGIFIILFLAFTGVLDNFLTTTLRYVTGFIYHMVVRYA